MTQTIPVVSDQNLTARAVETLQTYKNANWGDAIQFVQALPTHERVLVFGKVPDGLTLHPDVELIYTYSIAQVLTKSNAVSVLNAAVNMMLSGKHNTNVYVCDWSTPRTMHHYEHLFRYDEPIAIDIETDGILGDTHTVDEVMPFSVALYQDHWNAPITFVSGNSDYFYGPCNAFDPEELRILADYLPRFTKGVYHNGKFDTRVLNRVLDVRLCVWFDTMLAHHVLNHSAGEHGLKILAQRYFGADDWEKDMKKALNGSKDYSAMSVESVKQYNGWDVVWTLELFKFLKPQIDADPSAELNLFFEQQVADMLLDVEVNGIPVDEQYVQDYGERLTGHMESVKRVLAIVTGEEKFNPNSPKQIKDWFAKSGYIINKTDEAHLSQVAADEWPDDTQREVAQLILEFRESSKRKGTYVDGWSKRARNGRVHPTFLVHGTRTGRLSSTNPNAQNMPREKEVRKIVG